MSLGATLSEIRRRSAVVPVVAQALIGGRLFAFTVGRTFELWRSPKRKPRGIRRHIRRQKALGVVYPRAVTTRRIVSIDTASGTVEFE